ncbi:hypothetical protein BN59_01188 [Legionella massiliensis]|uniref:Uncharacterized protein n=1 Tax=Legionella massiliensis TaxID=1034943 RepID=A0A078KYT3_9GAMM|nr:hypothetical protein [Legionella massiliensis]CDZ76909.1 hypothetical protein BN59_01188 [Legionella massiliensis]CEE12647.1 hypothetical protein BN1094_01188 [Legionella massiliensis]
MSQSTKSMLTMMKPSVKTTQIAQSQSKKKPVEQKTSTKSGARGVEFEQVVDDSNIDEPVNNMKNTLVNDMKNKPAMKSTPVNEMENILGMCISSQNKNKSKLTRNN